MEEAIMEMTSDELFELAKARQAEEAETARREYKGELNSLRQQRRDLEKEHKRILNAIDKRIDEIRRKMSPTGTITSSTGGRNNSNISGSVLDVLQEHGQMDTKSIHRILGEAGVNTENLSQTLSYLKRQGKIIAPARAVYRLA